MADAPDAPTDAVRYELDGGCAVVTLDDGKLNTIGHGTLAALTDALRRAEEEATALVLVGGGRAFSAGFDLAVMTEGVESMQGLVRAGAEFMLELYGSPLPTVAACTGHALAGGVLMLLCCDERIGPSDRPAKIGLNEVAIGMGLPIFAVELARDRLSPQHLTPAVLGRVYDPAGAVEAGLPRPAGARRRPDRRRGRGRPRAGRAPPWRRRPHQAAPPRAHHRPRAGHHRRRHRRPQRPHHLTRRAPRVSGGGRGG